MFTSKDQLVHRQPTAKSAFATWLAALGLAALITLGQGCGSPVTEESERAALEGKWEVIDIEIDGISAKERTGERCEFAGNKYRSLGGDGETGSWGKYELDVNTSPKQIRRSMLIKRTDGTTQERERIEIYRFEGDKLQICLATAGGVPTEFASKPDKVLLTLKRVTSADAAENGAKGDRKKIQQAAFYALQPMVSGGYDGTFNVDFHRHPGTRNIGMKWWQNLLALRDIRKLCLRGCVGVGDKEMQYVGQLVSLESLDLHSTNVGNSGVEELHALQALGELDLSFTAVDDKGLGLLAKLNKLRSIRLIGSLVTAEGIEGLRSKRKDMEIEWGRPFTASQQSAARDLSQLGFEIDDRRDSRLWPATVTCQVRFPSRKIRDPATPPPGPPRTPAEEAERFYHPTLDPDEIAALFARLPEPTAVAGVDDTDDTVFYCLRNIQGLARLDLSGSRVTNAGLAELKRHQTLKVLDLAGAKEVGDAGIEALASLSNLEELNLRNVKISPEALARLLELDRLRVLAIRISPKLRELKDRFRQKRIELKME